MLAIRFATGDGQSSSSSQQETTAGVFGWPGGQWIVGAAGLVLIGVGAWHIRKGLNKHFLKQIDTSDASPKALRLVTRLGQIGFPGKGIALIGVGALLVWAAVTFDPSKARGLDGALRTILELPFGQILLTLVALGIAAFGCLLPRPGPVPRAHLIAAVPPGSAARCRRRPLLDRVQAPSTGPARSPITRS